MQPLTLAEWVLFALTGKVLIYIWFLFPLPPASNYLKKKYLWQVVDKLHTCDLCAGVWIYSFLAIVTGADMSGVGSLVTMTATGAITSFAVHVFSIGVKEKFQPPIVL
jgi:hypothetical protein